MAEPTPLSGAFASWMKFSYELMEKNHVKGSYAEKWARKMLLKSLRWKARQGRLFK